MPIFLYVVTRPYCVFFRFLNNRVLRPIGVYSYALYLVHFVVLNALWSMGYLAEGPTMAIVYAAVLSLIWAALVYRFVEQPLHDLGARLNANHAET